MMNGFRERIRELKAEFPMGDSALIPSIHEAVSRFGALSRDVAVVIADELGTKPEHVEAVASFYHLIKRESVGRFHFLVCTNLSCMICGAYDLFGWMKELLGVEPGQTTPDGLFSYEEAECIGSCDLAPAVLLNGERIGPLDTRDKLKNLLDGLRREVGNA
ncbi:MAG: NAD(P)H-dependent oxidoreductase subunit E [candidate division WOR-3 bacterium]